MSERKQPRVLYKIRCSKCGDEHADKYGMRKNGLGFVMLCGDCLGGRSIGSDQKLTRTDSPADETGGEG